MKDPTQYQANCSIEEINQELASIGFPIPQSIVKLAAGGEYHRVYRVTFSQDDYQNIVQAAGLGAQSVNIDADSNISSTEPLNTAVILRVAGSHIPKIKIECEVGILSHISRRTSIPAPRIVHYDATTSNALRHEYMIMTLLPGENGASLYFKLSPTQLSHVLDQLVDIWIEMYKLEFNHIGGVKPELDTTAPQTLPQNLLNVSLTRGPPVVETMWQAPDIERYFNNYKSKVSPPSSTPTYTFESLNAIFPNGYDTYSSWLAAQTQVYMHACQTHRSLNWVLAADHPNLNALQTFTNQLLDASSPLCAKLDGQGAEKLQFKLTHPDMHFGNILLSPEPHHPDTQDEQGSEQQYRITGILDWEFAPIMPFPLWRGAFLRHGNFTKPPSYEGTAADWQAEGTREREKLLTQWKQKVRERGGEVGRQMLRDMQWSNREQEAAWDVVNYLRCVVEVCPRDEQLDDATRWWVEIVRALGVLGIVVQPEKS